MCVLNPGGEYPVDRDGVCVCWGANFHLGDHLHYIDQRGVRCDWCGVTQGSEAARAEALSDV